MTMKVLLKITGGSLLLLLTAWGMFTLWAEAEGPARNVELGDSTSERSALIVYDPDPIYNLDERVCEAFGKALAEAGMRVRIATVAALSEATAQDSAIRHYDVYVFCANTYNWRPDRSVTRFINNAPIEQKPVVAITLGSGSTQAAQRALEKLIANQGGKVIGSRSYWLLRPNDDTRPGDSNVEACLRQVAAWAGNIGDSIQSPALPQR